MEWKIWELFFPPRCIFCGKLLTIRSELEICSACYGQLPFISGRLALNNGPGSFDIYYDGIVCVCEYSGLIKRSLVRYKFMEKPSYYRAFAGLLIRKLKQVTNSQRFDMIISVPLHWKKKRARGYNQALLVSRQVSRLLKLPECSHMLVRCRETASQSLLKKTDRQSNVSGAFIVTNPAAVAGKSILLLDDVMTTGSTVNECCRALKAAGAREAVAAVIASGRRQEKR
jgi:competence protein ComFC